jgi:tryptophan synthase beta subunit
MIEGNTKTISCNQCKGEEFENEALGAIRRFSSYEDIIPCLEQIHSCSNLLVMMLVNSIGVLMTTIAAASLL